MQLPIGHSDFKKIIESGWYFVDKSLFIREVLNDTGVILITRPRRFGKTVNMSMLRYFFGCDTSHSDQLFKNLKISKEDLFSHHQGKYVVIFLSFKDVKGDSYEASYQKILQIVANVYDQFSKVLLNSEHLTDFQKNNVHGILKKTVSQSELEDSLRMLSKALHDHYGKEILILIDEYDTAIQSGYLHGYYEQMVGFFRSFLGAALKDNPYLFKSVLTGILRVSKESLFSGLNNLSVYSMLHPKYAPYFGFTEEEVATLLVRTQLEEKAAAIKEWYNGYQVGQQVLYNPWSILSCVQESGVLKPYWVNTSDNELVKSLLLKSSVEFKQLFEALLEGDTVSRVIDENFVFSDLNKKNETAVWSLLIMTGYLKVCTYEETDQGVLCELAIPNREIRNLYRKIVEEWLANGQGVEWYNQFIEHLLNGDMVNFEKDLQIIFEQTVSYHDVGKEPEAFYHGFMLGVTATLYGNPNYETKSNRESGFGRYDYMIFSCDVKKPTILFEFKTLLPHASVEQLMHTAEEALYQIDERSYLSEITQRGASNILKIGLAFSGKRFGMAYDRSP